MNWILIFFSTGNSEVNWRASEWENGSDWEQETEADENQTDEGEQTTGKTKQADTASEADDGAETQETHGTARCVSVLTRDLLVNITYIHFKIYDIHG